MAAVVYEDPVKLQDGRYFVKASTNGSPVFVTVNNAKANTPTPWNPDSDILLSLSSADVNTVKRWDSVFVKDATENSAKWFQREIGEDVISSYYQSALDESTVEVQADLDKKGRVNVSFFDHANNIVDQFDSSNPCRMLLKFDGLWFLRKTFGPVWKVVQCKMRKVSEPVKCLIQDDEDSD